MRPARADLVESSSTVTAHSSDYVFSAVADFLGWASLFARPPAASVDASLTPVGQTVEGSQDAHRGFVPCRTHWCGSGELGIGYRVQRQRRKCLRQTATQRSRNTHLLSSDRHACRSRAPKQMVGAAWPRIP